MRDNPHDTKHFTYGDDPIRFWDEVELSDIIDEDSNDETIGRYIEQQRDLFREEWFRYLAESL